MLAACAAAAAVLAGGASLRPTALAVALAVAVVAAVCLASTEAGILLLVASIPLESTVEISSNPSVTIVKVAGAVCLLSWALGVMLRGERLLLDRTHALIFLLLAVAMLSTLQAGSLDAALVRTFRYASFAGLYLVISNQVGNHALQRRIVWTLSLSASASAVVGIQDFVTGATTLARPVHADPNDFAYILATTLPLTLWLLGERGLVRRAVVVAMAGLMGSALLLSFSRGALVGIGAGLAWQVLVERRHIRVVLLGTAMAGAVLFTVYANNQDRIATALYAKGVVAERNIDQRLDAWDAAVRLVLTHPVLGVGPGNFQFTSDRVLDRPPSAINPAVVHDAYLDVAAELGLLGFAIFMAYLLVSFARLGTSVRTRRGPPGMASAVRTALVVAVFATITLSEQYYAPLWLLGALATCTWHERRHQHAT